jgi:hypothetical protein
MIDSIIAIIKYFLNTILSLLFENSTTCNIYDNNRYNQFLDFSNLEFMTYLENESNEMYISFVQDMEQEETLPDLSSNFNSLKVGQRLFPNTIFKDSDFFEFCEYLDHPNHRLGIFNYLTYLVPPNTETIPTNAGQCSIQVIRTKYNVTELLNHLSTLEIKEITEITNKHIEIMAGSNYYPGTVKLYIRSDTMPLKHINRSMSTVYVQLNQEKYGISYAIESDEIKGLINDKLIKIFGTIDCYRQTNNTQLKYDDEILYYPYDTLHNQICERKLSQIKEIVTNENQSSIPTIVAYNFPSNPDIVKEFNIVLDDRFETTSYLVNLLKQYDPYSSVHEFNGKEWGYDRTDDDPNFEQEIITIVFVKSIDAISEIDFTKRENPIIVEFNDIKQMLINDLYGPIAFKENKLEYLKQIRKNIPELIKIKLDQTHLNHNKYTQ